MTKKQSIVLVACLLFGAGAVSPAHAVINSYRKILTETTYAAAAAPGALYAGTMAGVKKSVDDGATWTLVYPGGRTYGLAVDPMNGDTIYAATASGLYRSTDAGATWTLLNADVRYFVTVSPLASNVLFADNFKSIDGGATWHTVTGLGSYPQQRLHIKCSADPLFPDFLLASIREDSYRSSDNGETWQPFWRGVDSVEIDPTDARYYYLGGRCGNEILRYYPQGYSRVGPDHTHGLVVDPTNHARVFGVTDDNTTMVSTNFGATWRIDTTFSFSPASFMPYEGRMVFDASTGMVLVPSFQGLLAKNSWCPDADNDGFSAAGGVCGPLDCDDANPALNPKVKEDCWDSIDNNCDGALDMEDTYCVNICNDTDQDGFVSMLCRGADCNDANATVFPGAPELCDWRDNDCDGALDEDQPDQDGDGFSSCRSDCNDADPAIHPGAAETPFDGIDQDCNGYDLTIEVTKASYSPEKHGALNVRATSSHGANAWFWVDYYGSMHWEPKKGYWEFVMTGIGDNPGSVKVCSYEGCTVAPVVK